MGEDAETKKIANLTFDVSKAEAELTKLETHLGTISSKSEEFAKNISKNLNNVNIGSTIDPGKIKTDINKVEKIINDENKKMLNNDKVYIRNSTLQHEKGIEDRLTAEKKAMLKQEEYNNRVADSTKTLYDKITNYANTYLIYQGFNKLRQGITEVIDEMVNMEQQMVAIDRVMNVSGMNIDKFRDDLIQLAYDYGNSFDNVADISLRLAQAGIKSEANLKLTEKTLLALNTAELDATQATDDMVAVMSQWGYMTGSATEQAQKYGEIIDKINKVADNFPTTSQDIMNALKKVSSAFNLAGADIDETIATIVAAEKASQRGGKVIGTALSNITQQLRDEKRLNIAESLGLNFFKDAKKTEFKPIMEIFQEMSDKMAELKKEGKESSVEMQQMLELFTVFRRNIGASLLGEMEGGENSTYMQVYKTALNSVGYSIQENAKYMATAKAAQEQFNVSLLQLKTAVWDSGVEDVYKSMLILGKELVGNIGLLVKQFGGLPTVVGAVTLAFSLFSKQMKIVSYDTKTGMVNTSGFVKELTNDIKKFTSNITAMPKSIKSTMDVSNMSFATLKSNLMQYGVVVDSAALKTLALKAATIGLNLAASAAATAGMMLLTSIIQELMNKEAAAIQLQESSIQSTEKQISAREDEITNLNELIKRYDDLAAKTKLSPEETTELYEIQVKIKNILGDQADTIDLINGKYEEQKQKLNELTQEQRKQLLEDKKKFMEQKQYAAVNVALPSFVQSQFGGKDYEKNIKEYGGTGLYEGSLKKTLDNSTIEEAIELFTKWEENLRSVQGESVELANTYNWVNTTLNSLNEKVKESDDATRDYYETLASVKLEELFPEGSITSAEQYKNVLKGLEEFAENSTGKVKIYSDALLTLFKERFPEFAEATKETNEALKEANDTLETTKAIIKELEIDDLSEKMSKLQSKYSILTTAQKELSESGEITASTFKNLVDENLLSYLDVVNGKIIVNTGNMAAMAEETKIAAIESLKAAASEDIHKLALGKEADMSITAKNAIANFGNSASNAGAKARNAAGAILELASALAQAAAANSELAGENNVSDFSAKASAISGAYQSAARKIGAISISSASGSSSSRRSSGGSSRTSSGGSSKTNTAQQKKDDEYKRRLEKFTETLEKMEDKEEEWVKKQQELGLLSNKDMLYVTQQRIRQYEEYLKKIKKATWMNKEDRKKIQEEYTKKLKDSQLDYFEYLEDKLKDEVKAIEDARDKKIKALEEETDKRIALLKKQREAERDADERQEILDDISYWEQRTGREAVENLAEARKKLAEFDRDAQIDAQIQALEEREKAQKESLERQAQNQIDALQKEYDYKVKAFSESNKIIYDNSTIAAKNLYNTYKKNFVDPLKDDLKNINKKNINYTVKKGDTLASIAKKYDTTVKKIKAANKSNKNVQKGKVKKGQKIKIPTFHSGGIFSGTEEGLALLKRGEWVLKPEWSNSLNRMMKYFDNVTQGKTNGINNNSTIEVERKFD